MNLTRESFIALMPLLIMGATAVIIMLAIAVQRHHRMVRLIAATGLNAALISLYFAAQVGVQPVTPLLMVDGYALFYIAVILICTLACVTLFHAYLEQYQGNREEMYLLLILAASGGLVLACSRHFASLFIGLELLSVPVYAMVSYMFREKHSLEAGIKYMVLSAVASAFLLFGMALLYSQYGSLRFADIVPRASLVTSAPIIFAGIAMMLVGLGFKLSIAPFHLWTPDVYQGAPAPVGAFLATASKVAVFAALLRFFVEAPATHMGLVRDVFSALAVASIIIGNLLALMQSNLKRLLGYSSIAHFGYVLVIIVAGVTVSIEQTLEGVAMYLLTYVVTSLGAFGVVSLMSSPYRGHDADALAHYRGMFWRRPYLTAVMSAMMLSLAGIPITAGFVGKFYALKAGVDAQLWVLLGAVVIGSAMGLYYYLRVMITSYLAEPGMARYDAQLNWVQQSSGMLVIVAAAAMFFIGVYPQPVIEMIQRATMAL
ncbi:MAG TPA: NADH-quinone oxidoreductase subunit NuoN [Spongiibacteraceae bacterium]|nr:NADH-quinone oxidoreductase subunit NuoN [Spongiibacteraceae bacterium]